LHLTSPVVQGPRCGQTPLPVPDGDHDESPVLFNLETDLGEERPIRNSTAEYTQAMATINAGLQAHLASMVQVPNQMCNKGAPKTAGLGCVGGSSLDYTVCKVSSSLGAKKKRALL
jgi:hypothetical protein